MKITNHEVGCSAVLPKMENVNRWFCYPSHEAWRMTLLQLSGKPRKQNKPQSFTKGVVLRVSNSCNRLNPCSSIAYILYSWKLFNLIHPNPSSDTWKQAKATFLPELLAVNCNFCRDQNQGPCMQQPQAPSEHNQSVEQRQHSSLSTHTRHAKGKTCSGLCKTARVMFGLGSNRKASTQCLPNYRLPP